MRHESFRRCSLRGIELEKKVESTFTVVVIVVEESGVGVGFVHWVWAVVSMELEA